MFSYIKWAIQVFNDNIMKTQLIMAAVLTAVLALPSCSGEDAKLAGELAGTWKGSATEMMQGRNGRPDGDRKDRDRKDGRHDGGDRKDAGRGEATNRDGMDAGSMTCTPTITFVRTDGTNGGTLTVSADYTVTKGIQTSSVTAPVKASVNGTVSASGTWTVKDGDEVLVVLDPSKTVVDVDVNSMSLSYAKLTDAPKAALDSIKGSVASNITDVIKPMIAAKVQKMHKFDDVKVTGNTMTLKAGHNRIAFTKQ